MLNASIIRHWQNWLTVSFVLLLVMVIISSVKMSKKKGT